MPSGAYAVNGGNAVYVPPLDALASQVGVQAPLAAAHAVTLNADAACVPAQIVLGVLYSTAHADATTPSGAVKPTAARVVAQRAPNLVIESGESERAVVQVVAPAAPHRIVESGGAERAVVTVMAPAAPNLVHESGAAKRMTAKVVALRAPNLVLESGAAKRTTVKITTRKVPRWTAVALGTTGSDDVYVFTRQP
jgi:hypothetical protein